MITQILLARNDEVNIQIRTQLRLSFIINLSACQLTQSQEITQLTQSVESFLVNRESIILSGSAGCLLIAKLLITIIVITISAT